MRIPKTPPDSLNRLLEIVQDPEKVRLMMEASSPTVGERYIHWHRLRFRTPPQGLSKEDWWASIKFARRTQYRKLPLLDSNGVPFVIGSPDPMHRLTSNLDRDLSGRVALPEQISTPGIRDSYLMNALIEEAITSSQLEGASTTRKVGAEMLRSGRRPRNKSEQMIANNFRAMQFVREHRADPLTPELIQSIHATVTEDAIEEGQAGKWRTTDDICVSDNDGNTVHTPPLASEVPERMAALCRFANKETPEYYLHPIVRATLLHFWMGFDHPFSDGNGRTARALFYWSVLRSNYWVCEFVSISRILREAPSRYSRSYIYSENDELDATYFVLYQLSVLRRAVADLHEYLRRKLKGIRATQSILRKSQHFNHRQLALINHALANPDANYTATGHARSHMVTRQTARTDLKELAEWGILDGVTSGRGVLYLVPVDIQDRLNELGTQPGV